LVTLAEAGLIAVLTLDQGLLDLNGIDGADRAGHREAGAIADAGIVSLARKCGAADRLDAAKTGLKLCRNRQRNKTARLNLSLPAYCLAADPYIQCINGIRRAGREARPRRKSGALWQREANGSFGGSIAAPVQQLNFKLQQAGFGRHWLCGGQIDGML
jgi:hypothetical protein